MNIEAASSVRVLVGTMRNLEVEVTTVDAFQGEELLKRSALAGTLAAAAGLSGLAAGMVAMSMEEMREEAFALTFQLGDEAVRAILWANPFQDGDEVEVVAEEADGYMRAFAVLRPRDRIIALFPHVVSGRSAHVRTTIRGLLWMSLVVAIVTVVMLTFFWAIGGGGEVAMLVVTIGFVILGGTAIFSLIGWSVSRKYLPFVKMAEIVFASVGWKNPEEINLRKKTMISIRPDDPPALGPFYFRY